MVVKKWLVSFPRFSLGLSYPPSFATFMKYKKELKVYASGLTVKPFHSVGYCYRLDNNARQSTQPTHNYIKGVISAKSQSRLKTAVDWMVYLSENKTYYSKKTKQVHKLQLNFITLTLSAKQSHTDTFIVTHMLQPFLKWLERQGNELYIWKAETQANGNIHFHITTNKFIHYISIRNKWNSLQYNHGYMSKYISEHGDADVNSTDVRGLKNVKSASKYLAKYFSKKDESRRKIESKIWGCSRILSQLNLNFTSEQKDFTAIANLITSNSTSFNIDHFTIFQHKNQQAIKPMIDYFIERE